MSIVKNKKLNILIVSGLLALMFFVTCSMESLSAASITATAKVNSKGGAYLRKSASTKGAKVKLLKNNAKITIKKEVFTKAKSASSKYRWYYATTSTGKKGYIRRDCVDSMNYTEIAAQVIPGTGELFYRKGPGTDMKKKGSLKDYETVSIVLKAYQKGSSVVWYKVKINTKYYYACGKYLTTEIKENPEPVLPEKVTQEELDKVHKIGTIDEMAKALTWPLGTAKDTYTYGTGYATPIYKAIMSEWPKRTTNSNYGGCPRDGACCDRFVGCVMYSCHYDEKFPSGCESQWTYMDKHPEKWTPVYDDTENKKYTGDTSVLLPGDVIIYKKAKKSYHILLVSKNPKSSKLAIIEAQLLSPRSRSTYPHYNTSLSKISTDKVATYKGIKVYRAAKQ